MLASSLAISCALCIDPATPVAVHKEYPSVSGTTAGVVSIELAAALSTMRLFRASSDHTGSLFSIEMKRNVKVY